MFNMPKNCHDLLNKPNGSEVGESFIRIAYGQRRNALVVYNLTSLGDRLVLLDQVTLKHGHQR